MSTKGKNAMLDKVRKKLKGLQDSTTKTAGLWKPTGEHNIRIVPYKHKDDGFPFIELYFHWGINGKNYLSPISFQKPDPFVEFADKLKSTGDKEDFDLSRKLRPRLRIFSPILVRGEEKEGIRFWGYGKNMWEDIMKLMSDDDWGDITDVQNGTDLIVSFQSAEEAGNSFGKTSIKPKRKSSPLADDEKTLEKYLKEQKDITELYKVLTYDELKDVLEEWLSGENSEGSEKPSEEKGESKEEEVEEETDEKVNKASEAFDKLFNKDKA